MTDIMDWNFCTENFVRNVEIDPEKIASIVETAILRLEYLKKSPVDAHTVSFVVEGYYEAIKELLVALLLSSGLRSQNHQCLISYFYHTYPAYEAEAHLISQMSYLRNRLNYYGEQIDFGFYEKNKLEFERIAEMLRKLIRTSK